METPAGIDEVYRPHEARIHAAVFDTLSRPIHNKNKWTNRAENSLLPTEHQQNGQKIHITWRHFGQKTKFFFEHTERDLFEALHRKVRSELPNFRGNLAFHDDANREVILNCDQQIREAAIRKNNRLHIFTTLSDSPSRHLAASEIGTLSASRPSSGAPFGSPTTADDSSSPLLRATERASEEMASGGIGEQQRRAAPLAYPFWPAGELPIFFRSCWIGPNKFIYGGGWGWGGWGPIPSRKNWYCVVGGGRPPW